MTTDIVDPAATPEERPAPEFMTPDQPALPEGLQPVERAHAWVIRCRFAISWAPFMIGALVLDNFAFEEFAWRGALSAAIWFIALSAIIVAPQRIYRRIGYRLDPRSLRVVKGWLFHTDTIVPFVRVQHIDVARGPLEKIFGTASLIVHTAGTHNSVVVLPGLEPDRANEIRETIRAQIKTDWQ